MSTPEVSHRFPDRFNDAISNEEDKYVVSASRNTKETVITSKDGPNATQTSFSHQLSHAQLLDRCVMLRCKVQCTVTTSSSVAGRDMASLRGLALAQGPLSRIMKSCNVKINNSTITSTPHAFSRAAFRLQDGADLRKMNSLFPVQPDQANNMLMQAIMGGMPVNNLGAEIYGNESFLESASADSPYANFQNAGYGNSRCMFPPTAIGDLVAIDPDVAAGTQTFTFTVTEPLMHPLFTSSSEQDTTLGRIQNLDVNIVWGDVNGLFACCQQLLRELAGTGNSTVTVNGFVGAHELLIRTYNPVVLIPPTVRNKFSDINIRSFSVPTFTARGSGGAKTVSTGSIRFSKVPNSIVVFARPRADITTPYQADAFLAITGLTIRTDQDSGGFTGAQPEQLWQMSVRNGLDMSWLEFRYLMGSIIVIDLEKGDLSGYVAGTSRDFTFDMQVTLENTQYDAILNQTLIDTRVTDEPPITEWELQVLGYFDSALVTDGTVSSIESGLHPNIAVAVIKQEPPTASLSTAEGMHRTGGAFRGGSWYKKLGKSLAKFALPYASKIGTRLLDRAVNTGLGALGAGYDQKASGFRIMN